MDANYSLIAMIVFAVVVLVLVLIRRNKKDQANLEETVNKQEVKPEEHKDDDLKT